MRTVRQSFVVLLVTLGAAAAASQAAAQPRNGDEPVVVVGGEYTLAAGERVEDVVVIAGSALIEGEVGGDAVAVMGDITLADTARVEGDFVVVAGSATIEPGAVVERDLVVVASGLDAPPGFRPGGEQVVVVGGFWLGGPLRPGRAVVPRRAAAGAPIRAEPVLDVGARRAARAALPGNQFSVRSAGARLRGRADGEAAEHRPSADCWSCCWSGRCSSYWPCRSSE